MSAVCRPVCGCVDAVYMVYDLSYGSLWHETRVGGGIARAHQSNQHVIMQVSHLTSEKSMQNKYTFIHRAEFTSSRC